MMCWFLAFSVAARHWSIFNYDEHLYLTVTSSTHFIFRYSLNRYNVSLELNHSLQSPTLSPLNLVLFI